MKNFFEFYQFLKTKKLNEQDMSQMQPGMPQNAMGGMGGMGAMGGMGQSPMGGQGSPSPFPSMVGQPGANQPGVVGMDMDLDMGAADQGGNDRVQKQTDEPQGEQDPTQLMDNLKSIMTFVKDKASVGDDEEKAKIKEELTSQLEAVMENLGKFLGVEVPSSDQQPEGEMGGEQPDESLPDMSGGAGANPMGGNAMPSDAGGAGDMGSIMGGAGGAAPQSQMGGMGGMGGGMSGL